MHTLCYILLNQYFRTVDKLLYFLLKQTNLEFVAKISFQMKSQHYCSICIAYCTSFVRGNSVLQMGRTLCVVTSPQKATEEITLKRSLPPLTVAQQAYIEDRALGLRPFLRTASCAPITEQHFTAHYTLSGFCGRTLYRPWAAQPPSLLSATLLVKLTLALQPQPGVSRQA